MIKGLRRHISDTDEDVIVLKLLEEFDVAGYEIVKKPGNAGFTFETPAATGASSLRSNWQERQTQESLTVKQWQ